MIFCHPKTQLLTTLLMWQGSSLSSFTVFFLKKKKKGKNYHVNKGGPKLYFRVTMCHISIFMN
jgi:hypothetical protein